MPIAIGFCDDNGDGFSTVQPAHHVEQWQLPVDNGTHLVIHWRPLRSVCGLNVTQYHVDVRTSSPFLNQFVAIFGKMPQDVCAPGSIARGSVAVDNVQQGDGGPSACTPYERYCDEPKVSAVLIARSLRALANLDVWVSVRAFGMVAPQGNARGKQRRVTFWCHKYRKAQLGDTAADGDMRKTRQHAGPARWLSSAFAWRRSPGVGSDGAPPRSGLARDAPAALPLAAAVSGIWSGGGLPVTLGLAAVFATWASTRWRAPRRAGEARKARGGH